MKWSPLALSVLCLALSGCPSTDDGKDGDDDTGSAATDNDGDGVSVEAGDCDDSNADINPGADELCDGVDNNCDGTIDEDDAVDAVTWYDDTDQDGYGDASDSQTKCTAPTGYIADNTDCDDAGATINPGADELCDGVDNNCDGTIDEDDAVDAVTWYADTDQDGYGDASDSQAKCTAPTGYIADNTDCDDSSADINPSADELCDAVDNDCDGTIDEDDAVDAATWYDDTDQDGYGDPSEAPVNACAAHGDYTASNMTDCDDNDASIEDESTWYLDADQDSYGDPAVTPLIACFATGFFTAGRMTDCDDSAASINPGATEVWNGVDDNCDGSTDEGVAGDLTVEGVNLTGAYTVASSGSTEITFLISSDAATDVDATVYVVHSTNTEISSADTTLATLTLTLPAAGTLEHTEPVTVPSGLSNSTDAIGIIIDPLAALSETDETNNTGYAELLISSSVATLGANCFGDSVDVAVPEHVSGGLSTSSDHFYGGTYKDDIEVELTWGVDYEFFVSTDDTTGFDTVLTLYGTDCVEIDSNDDAGSGTNSRLSFTAPSTGIYTLVVSGYDETEYGDYDFVANESVGNNCLGLRHLRLS